MAHSTAREPTQTRPLVREDIVGRTVVRALQSPWKEVEEVSVSRGFVELDNGVAFELKLVINEAEPSLVGLGIEHAMLIPAELAGVNQVGEGLAVREVVVSDYWPTIGLLLSNDLLLYMDAPGPGRFGVCISLLGDFYQAEAIFTYWDRTPLTGVPRRRKSDV